MFRVSHSNSDVVYGRGSVQELGEYLSEHDLERGLLVCGSNVGANDEVMRPVLDGAGDRLEAVFDGTTPEKSIEDVYNGIEAIQETQPDVLIGIGGGSSLDIARQMSVMEADGRSLPSTKAAAREDALTPPERNKPLLPVIVIPTTFAGAADSTGGSMIVLPTNESPTNQPIRIGGANMPIAMFYDPNLFETTPMSALAGSMMNGFNKGIETLYSSDSSPFADAAATHGLKFFQEGLPKVARGDSGMERSVVGSMLVQFDRKVNIIHAFGHGFSRRYPIQQGEIHAIMAPHILRYVFDEVDGERTLIAEGLNIATESKDDDELADEIIKQVVEIRDSFDLPSKLREIECIRRTDFNDIAKFIVTDDPMESAPNGIAHSQKKIEAILQQAW